MKKKIDSGTNGSAVVIFGEEGMRRGCAHAADVHGQLGEMDTGTAEHGRHV